MPLATRIQWSHTTVAQDAQVYCYNAQNSISTGFRASPTGSLQLNFWEGEGKEGKEREQKRGKGQRKREEWESRKKEGNDRCENNWLFAHYLLTETETNQDVISYCPVYTSSMSSSLSRSMKSRISCIQRWPISLRFSRRLFCILSSRLGSLLQRHNNDRTQSRRLTQLITLRTVYCKIL